MFGLFGGTNREQRRLNKDAAAIIESTRAGVPVARVREIAGRVESTLREAHARGGGSPRKYAPLIAHFRTLHREARRRRDDTALTAYTLVIIYLRAEMIGEGAQPARAAIDELLRDWAHAFDPAKDNE